MISGHQGESETEYRKMERWVRGDVIQVTPSWSAYNGLDTETGEFIIVKEIAIASDATDQEKARYRELTEQLSVLERKNLNHPNLLTIRGYVVKEDLIRITSTAWIHGTIKIVLEKHGSIAEETARFFTRQILNGLVDLYENEERHGNLSTDNTFLEVEGIIKASDFGLPESAIAYSNFVSAQAPETAKQTNQSDFAKIDTWSVGYIVLEMLTGKAPWDQNALQAVKGTGADSDWDQLLSKPLSQIGTDASDFIKACLLM